MLYDRFSSFIKFSSSERNTENTISDLYFNEESDYSEENVTMKSFNLPQNRERRVVMKTMRQKLNIFTLQLPIYYILKQEISIGTNADIAETKREK